MSYQQFKMNIILSYIILSYIWINYGTIAQNISTCTTPDMVPGLCIPLRNCTSLFNRLLKGNDLTSDDRQHLSSSQCGYKDNHPNVCCPDQNIITVVETLPQPGKCGVNPMYRIFRGITTELDTYPWMVLLEYSKPNNTKGLNCIGILISLRYVLTAAHCVNGRDIPNTWNLTGVRLGEYDLLNDPDCENFRVDSLDCNPSVIDVPISEIIVHQLYNPQTKNGANDIALLKLRSDVENSDLVHPICLPWSQKLRNLTDHATFDAVGWNKASDEYSVKLAGSVKYVENAQCNRVYNRTGVSIQDTQLCGTALQHTYDPCKGLPGSPIMKISSKDNHIYWYLVGIEAFGPPTCGQEDLPNVYTRIIPFIDWIESKVNA